jgi:RimJ/RimL family protein N-acetyltransferase
MMTETFTAIGRDHLSLDRLSWPLVIKSRANVTEEFDRCAMSPLQTPMVLDIAALEGRFVRLEPLEPPMKAELRDAIAGSPQDWAIMVSNGGGEAFDAYWEGALGDMAKGRRIAFAIRRRRDGRIVGTTSYLDPNPRHRRVEIGSTFLALEARAGAINPDCKLTLLTYAFSRGAHRVEFMIDEVNARSQAAVLKLGAQRDGVLRRNMVTWTGRVRDTGVFSITDLDWPAVQARLEARVAAFG